MEVRVYQINANRDFMGFAFAPLSKQTSNAGKTVQAQFYDCVYEGHVSYEDFYLGYYTFEKRGPYPLRHVYISDVIEVIASEDMEPGFYYVDPCNEYVRVEFDPDRAREKEEIRVVLVNPGEEAKIVDIEATDASFEDLTGGIVGIRDYGDEMTRMVYNRYGQEMGMTTNRLIFKGPNSVEAVQGPFFVCSSRYSSYESLPVELQRKIMAELKYPQRFQKRPIPSLQNRLSPSTRTSPMNDKKHHASSQRNDYAELNRNKRLLADYIRNSIWDEKMNQIREYWLWERSGIYPKKPEHYIR